MFDPTSCFNPEKAFTFEGLVSRDMLEHFMQAQYDNPTPDNKYPLDYDWMLHAADTADQLIKYGFDCIQDRLNSIADRVSLHIGDIIDNINAGKPTFILIQRDRYLLYSYNKDNNWKPIISEVMFNNGPPLSRLQQRDVLFLMSGNIHIGVTGQFRTAVAEENNGGLYLAITRID